MMQQTQIGKNQRRFRFPVKEEMRKKKTKGSVYMKPKTNGRHERTRRIEDSDEREREKEKICSTRRR